MSLFDAFIDDPLGASVQKRAIHIAIRRDGGVGADGTADNPFDGSTPEKLDSNLNPSAITKRYAFPNIRFIFGAGIGGFGLFAWITRKEQRLDKTLFQWRYLEDLCMKAN